MNRKCNKYEGLFVFSNEEELKKHIEECEFCKNEQEKLDKISDLIKEARPLFIKQEKRKKTALKTACAMVLLVLTASFITTFNVNSNTNSLAFENIKYGQSLSAEDYGFPVDSYGLIMVGE